MTMTKNNKKANKTRISLTKRNMKFDICHYIGNNYGRLKTQRKEDKL